MRKAVFIFAVIILHCFTIQAQSDAALLEKAHQIAQYVGVTEGHLFLRPDDMATSEYVPVLFDVFGRAGDSTLFQILDRMEGNPFLSSGGSDAQIWILNDAKMPLRLLKGRSEGRQGSQPVGGFKVTTIADGITKFLISRAKEELSIAFFKQFKEDICTDKRLTTLFPGTASTLTLVDKDIYQFNRYLESLRESFIKDIKTAPTNLSTFLVESDIIKSGKYKILSEDALAVTQFFMDGVGPDSIINWLAYSAAFQQAGTVQGLSNQDDKKQLTDLAATFQTLNMLSNSLRSTQETKTGWINTSDAKKYIADPNTFLLYQAMLWQKGSRISFADGNTFQFYLGKTAVEQDKATAFSQLIRNFAQSGEQVRDAAASYRLTAQDAPYEPFYRFIDGFTSLLETGIQFKISVAGIVTAPSASDSALVFGLRHLNEMNYDVRQKNYAASINDLMYVLQYLAPEIKGEGRDKIFKYGHFMASVAGAQSSDEVAAAIEAVALPAGSSRVKKENHFSAALNAYAGFAFGGETLSNNRSSLLAALHAPIGFTVSWKFRDLPNKKNGKQRTPGSFSLFTPIIDVGSLMAFRINDPYSNTLPELKWSNLLSPGMYGVFGFRNNLPISLGIGAQRGPSLRKISGIAGQPPTLVSAWRYGMFLSVDIPVFNLFVQSQKK